MPKFSLILVIIFLLSSCKSRYEKEVIIEKNLKAIWGHYLTNDFSETKALDVFIVTNRAKNLKNFGCNDSNFGVKFASKLQFGLCKINVPKNHDVGSYNLAKNNHDLSDDYYKILANQGLNSKQFFDYIKKSEHKPVIFVHGFNVDYQYAILRASQIAYDLKYQGPVILFSWPAGAKDGLFTQHNIAKTYKENTINARVSIEFFKRFLQQLHKNNIKPNLMVHSMGHQVVLPALDSLGKISDNPKFINKLILHAPDFGAKKFRKIANNVKKTSDHITLYCSQKDKAIIASSSLNENDRLGSCINIKGIDVINVSTIYDKSFEIGHDYYSSRPLLGDLFQNLLEIDVSKRLFIKKAPINSEEQYFLRK